jgi:hypothetical protein
MRKLQRMGSYKEDFAHSGRNTSIKENKGPDYAGPLFSSSHNRGQAQKGTRLLLVFYSCFKGQTKSVGSTTKVLARS